MTHNRLRRTPALSANTPDFRVIGNVFPSVQYPYRAEVEFRNKHIDSVDITINGHIDETLEPGDIWHAQAEDLGEPIFSYHVESPSDITDSDQGDFIIVEHGGLTERVDP